MALEHSTQAQTLPRGSARTGQDMAARSQQAHSRSPSNAGFQVFK